MSVLSIKRLPTGAQQSTRWLMTVGLIAAFLGPDTLLVASVGSYQVLILLFAFRLVGALVGWWSSTRESPDPPSLLAARGDDMGSGQDGLKKAA